MDMKIKSAAVLGAGAVGAYFVYGLTDHKNLDFCVIADGARKERLERDGITIDDRKQVRTFRPVIRTPEEARGVDLLISSERRKREDGKEVISFNPDLGWGVYLGEKGSRKKSGRIRAIEELLADTPCGAFFVEDILRDQWAKYASNICYNLPQAILDLPYRAYFDSEHVEYIRRKMFEEVRTVGAAYGIDVPEPILYRDTCAEDARFSTLQDLDAGRHTEVDMFLGVLMEKAAAAGIEVPWAEFAYHAIKALEEKNDGRFG